MFWALIALNNSCKELETSSTFV